MKLNKRYIPYALLGFLLISQLVVVASRIDVWPFSSYQMFSRLKPTVDVGAYRLEAVTRDNQSVTVHLRGHKDVWQVYHNLLNDKNNDGLNSQIKVDFEDFLAQHPEIDRTNISEVRLLYVSFQESEKQEKAIANKVLHSMRL